MEFDRLPRAQRALFSQRGRNAPAVLQEMMQREWHL
jgi:hypothetical protein